jgi:hypothetical protein
MSVKAQRNPTVHQANNSKGIHFYSSLASVVDPAVAKATKFIADRRAEGGALFKSIQVDKPKREQERLRDDLSRLNLNYGNKPPPPVPQTTRTSSMPGYGYSSAPPTQGYTYSPPSSQTPQSYQPPPPQATSPQGYPPQNPYTYQPSPPPSQYPSSPSYPAPQGQFGLPPPLQPKPGQQAYRSPPPPPPGQSQGQGGYGYRSPY